MWILLHCFRKVYTAGEALLDCTNLFSPNDYQNNDKPIYKYSKEKYGKRKRNRLL